MHHVRQSLSPGQRMIVQIPSISPLVLQMLGFDVFIIHLSSLRREGTRSVPLNYQILFLPVTMRQEAHYMGDRGKERDGQGAYGKRERKREELLEILCSCFLTHLIVSLRCLS